jgi:flagellar hook-associated protein 2
MATITAAGVGSNLDVNGLVTQLMAVERQPLTKMQSKVSGFRSDLSDYGRVRSDVSSLQSAAKALGDTSALDVFKATLSNTTVGSVTAGLGASAGTYSISVNQLASNQTLVSPNAYGSGTTISDPAAVITGSATLTLSRGASTSFTVNVADQSLNGIRDAINTGAGNFGVSASVVNDGSGYRLVLRTRDTGAANAVTGISVSSATNANLNFLGYTAGTVYPATDGASAPTTFGQSVTARDANITVDGLTVTAANNVFSSAIQGVTFVAKTTGSVTLDVARDNGALVAKAEAFVSAYNTFMSNSASRYGKGGLLANEGTLLTMMNGFSDLVSRSGGVAGGAYSYLIQLGFSVDKLGTMTLNSRTFTDAVDTDPVAVAKALGDSTDGLMARFNTAANAFLTSGGVIGAREDGLNAVIKQLNDRIDAFNNRLAGIETRYRTQFSKLDSLLGSLSQTSAALTRALG